MRLLALMGSLLLSASLYPSFLAAASPLQTPELHGVELATFRGVGAVLSKLVGSGRVAGSERLWCSYAYMGGSFEIVAIDPVSGASDVYPSPVKTESGAWAMALGPDGKLYVGTLPHAHMLRLDPATGAFTDLGRPSPTETYIWQLALGSDRRLYGCTYPSCKLVRYDPASGRMEDLGRMDPREQYARFVAASGDGFIYVGIGTGRAHLVAYEIRTGEHRDILPEAQQVTGTAVVAAGEGGVVFAYVGEHRFRLQGWQAVPISAAEYRPAAARLRDGRVVTLEGNNLRVMDPRTRQSISRPVRYTGKEIDLFRLGLGPDGMLYASTALPSYLSRMDPLTGSLTTLGQLGGGECYSFLSYGQVVLAAAYSSQAPLMIYHPGRLFHPGVTPQDNPQLIHFPGEEGTWRPQAMIPGPDGKVYLGAIPGYGKLGGPLAVFDPAAGTVEAYPQIVKDQSPVSLAIARASSGGNWWVVGGTTVLGGGGATPLAAEAKLFLWDPRTRQKLFETVPVGKAQAITDVMALPDGPVFGIADGTAFVFDTRTRQVIDRARLPFSGPIYNAIAVGPDGHLYGLYSGGVFSVDPHTYAVRIVGTLPQRVTAGFAMKGSTIFYAAGPHILRCDLPIAGSRKPEQGKRQRRAKNGPAASPLAANGRDRPSLSR
jgi:streptogramin lyase